MNNNNSNEDPLTHYEAFNYDFSPGDKVNQDAPVVEVPGIKITDLHVLDIKPDEVLVIKYDPDAPQHDIEMFAKALRQFLRKAFGNDMGDRVILIPRGWDLEKLKAQQGPVEHPLYETKTPE